MTTISNSNTLRPARRVATGPATVQRLAAANWPLTLATVLSLALFAATIIGVIIDPRVITGAPAWIKPMKFAISSAIYTSTLLWLLTFVQGHRRLAVLVSAATSFSLVVELVIIVAQALRGATSHFNVSTPLDGALWSTMAGFIMTIWVMNLIVAGMLLRQKLPDAAFAWSLRLGMLISAVGMAVAFLMTVQPSPAQAAAMPAGQAPAHLGAHSVGVEDGGPGLPFVGWSTAGGDLRVAHFAGLHGLQVLPLLGLLFSRLGLIWTAALGYLGLVLLLAWQALRGQPLIHPDALTLAEFAALLVAVGAVSRMILRRRVAEAATA